MTTDKDRSEIRAAAMSALLIVRNKTSPSEDEITDAEIWCIEMSMTPGLEAEADKYSELLWDAGAGRGDGMLHRT